MEPEDSSQELSQGFSQGQEENSGTGFNPAWNDLMQYIPEERHSDASDVLSKWDDNYRQVQSKYKNWQRYDEAGVEPEEIETALGLLSAVSNQPQEVLTALQQWVDQENNVENQQYGQQGYDYSQGFNGQPNSYEGQGQGNSSFDLTNDPNFQRLNEGFETMAEILAAQREREQEEAEDAEVEAEFESLRSQYGDFDENYVIGQMLQGATGEEAVQAYQSFVNDIRTQSRRPTPRVLGASGSIPNQEIDPRKLDSKGTRNLVAQMLQEVADQE